MSRNPSAEESAAIAAAIELFRAETAPAAEAEGEEVSPWQRAALVEGVGAKATVQRHLEGGTEWLS
jgi:hypothetical protein